MASSLVFDGAFAVNKWTEKWKIQHNELDLVRLLTNDQFSRWLTSLSERQAFEFVARNPSVVRYIKNKNIFRRWFDRILLWCKGIS